MSTVDLNSLSPAARTTLNLRARSRGLSREAMAVEMLEGVLQQSVPQVAWSNFSSWLLRHYDSGARLSCLSALEAERRKAALLLATRSRLDPEEVFGDQYEDLCYEAGLSPDAVTSLMDE